MNLSDPIMTAGLVLEALRSLSLVSQIEKLPYLVNLTEAQYSVNLIIRVKYKRMPLFLREPLLQPMALLFTSDCD